ncbi:MAG: hypothetical protein ACE5ET_05595 [Gammaproteobacteria bacterium]
MAGGNATPAIDRQNPALYSWRMNGNHTDDTLQLNLAHFAADIEELLGLCEKLQLENSRLRTLNARLQAEKTQLAQRNQLSQDKIEGMINRLKSLEVEL